MLNPNERVNAIRERSENFINSIQAAHKKLLDDNVTEEFLDLIKQGRAYDYHNVRRDEEVTKIDHEVNVDVTEHGDYRYVITFGSGLFQLSIIYSEGNRFEYVFFELMTFSGWDLKQQMGESKLFDIISNTAKVNYISVVTAAAWNIDKIIYQYHQERRCKDLNVTMVELSRIDDDIALEKTLESFGRSYESYVLRSGLGRINRPQYLGVVRQPSGDVLNISLRMGWLCVTMNISKDGSYQYHMPILNLTYNDIRALVSDRFDHMTSVGLWDIVRSNMTELEGYEAKVIQLAVKIMNYEDISEENCNE